jgi:hypothetical protein
VRNHISAPSEPHPRIPFQGRRQNDLEPTSPMGSALGRNSDPVRDEDQPQSRSPNPRWWPPKSRYDGGKSYRLHVPANPPVKQYWSVTVYDRELHTLLRAVKRASRASNASDVQKMPWRTCAKLHTADYRSRHRVEVMHKWERSFARTEVAAASPQLQSPDFEIRLRRLSVRFL